MVNLAVKLAVVHSHKMKAIQFDEHLQFVMNGSWTLMKPPLFQLKIFKPTFKFLSSNFRPMETLIQYGMIIFDRRYLKKSCFMEIYKSDDLKTWKMDSDCWRGRKDTLIISLLRDGVFLIEDIYSLMINSCLESFMLVDVISSINSSGGGGDVLKTGPVVESVFEPSSSANTLTV